GERDRHDLPGMHVPFGEQIGDASGEHPRLARASTGDHEQRRARVLYGASLLVVEVLEQLRRASAGRLGGGLRRGFEQSAHRGNNGTGPPRQRGRGKPGWVDISPAVVPESVTCEATTSSFSTGSGLRPPSWCSAHRTTVKPRSPRTRGFSRFGPGAHRI